MLRLNDIEKLVVEMESNFPEGTKLYIYRSGNGVFHSVIPMPAWPLAGVWVTCSPLSYARCEEPPSLSSLRKYISDDFADAYESARKNADDERPADTLCRVATEMGLERHPQWVWWSSNLQQIAENLCGRLLDSCVFDDEDTPREILAFIIIDTEHGPFIGSTIRITADAVTLQDHFIRSTLWDIPTEINLDVRLPEYWRRLDDWSLIDLIVSQLEEQARKELHNEKRENARMRDSVYKEELQEGSSRKDSYQEYQESEVWPKKQRVSPWDEEFMVGLGPKRCALVERWRAKKVEAAHAAALLENNERRST